MSTDPEIIRNWLMAINMLSSAAVFLFVFIDRRHHASSDSIRRLDDKIDHKLNEFQLRLGQAEADIKQVPAAADIVRLHDRIDEIHRDTQQTNLMIGKLMGQIEEMSLRRRRSDYES